MTTVHKQVIQLLQLISLIQQTGETASKYIVDIVPGKIKMGIKILFLFFVSCGVSVHVNAGTLGSYRCTFGPSYWCRDYEKAVECNAVQHCQEKVWKTNADISMGSCTLCELAINTLKVIVDQTTVQEQFIEFLEDLCNKLGLGPFVEECKAVVKYVVPLIMKSLDQLLGKPKRVCKIMGLCESKDEQVVLASLISHARPGFPFANTVTESQKCVICKSVMAGLNKIPNRTKRIEVLLKKVCSGKASSEKEKCVQAVTMLGSSMITLLKTKVNEICVNYNAALCKETSVVHKALEVARPAELQDLGCDFCIYLMSTAEDLLRNSSMTEKQFEKAIMLLCEDFKLMASKCREMVSEYVPLLYELLSKLKPYQVCQEIMMCPAAADFRRDPRCMLGASFWCASLTNAQRCNALQYCKIKGWKNL